MASPSIALKSQPNVPVVQQQRLTIEQRQRRWGWVFLSPWIFGFLVFTLVPMVASLYFSFTDFTTDNGITHANWIGLKNWNNLLFLDPAIGASLAVTFKYGLIALPVSLAFPLLLALLLNSKWLLGKPILRVLFYLPYIVPSVAGLFVWKAFLNGNSGWLALALKGIGVQDPPDWLGNPSFVNTGLVLIGLWGVGNAMLTMMASMQGVPTELYEAARVDGANPFVLFIRITFPMITPVIFYNLVLTVIGLLQFFDLPYILRTIVRSDESLSFINVNLYLTAFTNHNMGYGSAIAWFLFLIGLVITVLLFITSRRWVYYASGE